MFEYSSELDVVSLHVTASADEDVGSLTGWSLGGCRSYNSVQLWGGCSDTLVLVGLYGAEVLHVVDLKTGSDTGTSNTDDITKTNTPVITVSGFEDTASVTVTADHTTDSGVADVTGSITGNGDVTMGTLADGVWNISATDGTNTSNLLSVTVDTALPTISSVQPIGNTVDTTPELTFATTEAGVLVANSACGIPAATVAPGQNTITLTELAFGTYSSCTLQMKDTAGNTSTAMSIAEFVIVNGMIAITMATTPAQSRSAVAVVTGTSPSDRNWVLFDPSETSPVPTCADGSSNLDFTGATAYTSGTAVTVTSSEADNGKKVCFRATISGVTFYQASEAIAGVDTTAPTKPTTPDLTTDTGASSTDDITNNNTPTITTTAVANATYEWTVDGAVNNSYTTNSITTTALSNGDHTFSVKVTDRAGNQSVASDTLTITVDTTVPTVALTNSIFTNALSTTDTYINSTEATADQAIITAPTGSDGGGAYTFAYKVITSSTACTSNLSYSATIPVAGFSGSDGTYKVCVRVTDVAGNIQYVATPIFTKDTIAPTVALTNSIFTNALSTTDTYINSTEATADQAIITAPTGSDGGGAYTFAYKVITSSTACTSNLSYSATIPVAGFSGSDGTYKVCVRVTDVAGNIQYTATPTFTKDTTAPTLSGVSDIGSTRDTTPDLTFTTSEAGVLVLNSACGIPASAVTRGENTITLTALAFNTYSSCTFQMTDTAGNTSAVASIDEFVIQTPPVTVILHNDSGAGDNVNTGSYTPDNLTSDTTPTITLAGFTGSTDITASHAIASDVTHTLASGNGDYTFTTALAEGEWTITATDGTSTGTLTITILHALVSNTGETNDGTLLTRVESGTARKIAQSFTTGGLPFELEEVLFNVVSTSFPGGSNSSSFEIELMTSTGTPSRPGSRVTTNGCNIFNGIARSTLVAGAYTYEISTGRKPCKLQPYTEYFLVFQIKNVSTSGSVNLSAVSSDAQSGQTEWSTANTCLATSLSSSGVYDGAAGTWSDCSSGRSVKLGLFGKASPGVDLKVDSDTGSSQIDNITSDSTPTVILAGFTQGTATAITATHGTASAVNHSIASGNGEVDLPLLPADGVWTIVARQGSDTSNSLSVTVDSTVPLIDRPSSIGITTDTTPDLTFTTSEAGTLVENTACGIPVSAVTRGENTITLTELAPGDYNSCTLFMKDVAGNRSPLPVDIPDFTILEVDISIGALSTDPAQSRSATATVTGTSPSDLNWVLFDPTLDTPETCGSGLTFPSGQTYVSGEAVTITSSDADNGKKACFRATVSSTTVYQESDTIAGVDTTVPTVALTNSIFTNALSTTDTYINSTEATANQAIITAPTGSDTGGAYTFAYTTVASSETCDGDLTYSATIPVAGFSGSDGTYKVCVRVTDTAGNIQYTTTPTFTKDTTAPTLSAPSSIGSTADTTPEVSFTTTEGGSLTLGGSCATTTTSVTTGTKTITLDALTPATYSNCTITVTDTAGNASNALAIPSFSVVSGSIAITMATTPAQSRSATATVSATATNRNWVLFDPAETSPAPTCGGTTSNLDFTGATAYTSGTAVTVTSSESDNGKKACFRATIGGVTFYQASDAIAGVDTTAPSSTNNP